MNLFGGLAAAGAGAVKGYTEDAPRIFDMMGMEALGKAFQVPQPIQAMNDRGPQPPMPGQPSMPPQAPPQQGGMPQQPAMAGGPPSPMGGAPPGAPPAAPAGGPGGAGGPPPGLGPTAGPPGGGIPRSFDPGYEIQRAPQGGPQGMFDVPTLANRIRQANPNLPPQAMIAALTRAVPLLNTQGKLELAQLRQQYQQQMMDYRGAQLDRQERRDQTMAVLGTRRVEATEKAEEGRNTRFGTREGRLGEQFTANQERLRNNADRRFADSAARLDEMVKRRLSGEDKSRAVQELRLMEGENRANHQAITEQIQANNMLNATDRDRLLKEAVQRRDENLLRIEGYRAKLRANKGEPSAPAASPTIEGMRPRARSPDGREVEWDGKAWVPVK